MRGILRLLLAKFPLQAILELGADLGNFHARAYQKLATEQFVRLIFVQELSGDAAILAVLIPAESAVRDGFGANVLKGAENGIFSGTSKIFPRILISTRRS